MTVAPIEIDVDALLALPRAEREEQIARLRSINAGFERNPFYRYIPHEGERGFKLEHGIELTGDESRGQVAFHEASGELLPEAAIVGGNRSGKTEGGVADCLAQILPRELVPVQMLPYRHRDESREYFCRAVGVDLPRWLKKALLPKLRRMVPREALWRGDFDKAYDDRDHVLRFADGSWWDFLTHDMDIDSYASADLDRVWFDEEPPGEKGKQQVEESHGRLVDRDGDMRWTLTPLLGLSHVYYELTDSAGEPRDDDECRVVVIDMDHNPHISARGRRRFLKRFAKDPLKLQARKSGRWVHLAGQIYEEFNERDVSDGGHLRDARPIPRVDDKAKPSVPVFEWIDPGIDKEHPAAFGVAWLNPDDTLEVFHTFKLIGGTAGDMAAHIKATRERFAYKPRGPAVIDPSARNKHHGTGKSTQGEYRKHGINTIAGQNSVIAGINAVKERLKTNRLVIHHDCHEGDGSDLPTELREYRWKGNKRSSSEDAPKPEPIKKRDDLADGLRYLIMQLPRPRDDSPSQEERELARLGPGDRALREHMKRIRRRGRRRARIGGVVP